MPLTLTSDFEAAIEQSVREGRFVSVDDAMGAALELFRQDTTITSATVARLRAVRKKTLLELMQESPFYGTDIEFPRDRSPMREIDFD